jgi:hypothetical protein
MDIWESAYVVIDHRSMSFGIEMLGKITLLAKQTTAILALDRFWNRLFKTAHSDSVCGITNRWLDNIADKRI